MSQRAKILEQKGQADTAQEANQRPQSNIQLEVGLAGRFGHDGWLGSQI